MTRSHNMGSRKVRRFRERLLMDQDGRCAYCDAELTLETSTLEHRVPISLGGKNTYGNYAVVCDPCNQRASAHTQRDLRALLTPSPDSEAA